VAVWSWNAAIALVWTLEKVEQRHQKQRDDDP